MNPLSTKSDAQLRAEKAAILRELSARRKARKPKVRKVRTSEELERARAYVNFPLLWPFCWACGRQSHERPSDWDGVWLPNERAHIVSHPRREDCRAIVSLCSLCHAIHHGLDPRPWGLKPIKLPHLLWLKFYFEGLDLPFLQTCSTRILPGMEPLPMVYRNQYVVRHLVDQAAHAWRPDDEALALTKGEGR